MMKVSFATHLARRARYPNKRTESRSKPPRGYKRRSLQTPVQS